MELPELTREERGEPDWIFERAEAGTDAPPELPWDRHWSQTDDSRWSSVARTPAGYRLRFWDLADFVVDLARARIVGEPRPSTEAATLRHLLIDHVVPLLSSRGRRLVVHAGAVVTPEGACAFLGESGRGKSTLTASFARQGFRVLGDDALMLSTSGEALTATPSYPGVRLWPDMLTALGGPGADSREVAAYTTKKRLVLRPGAPPGSVPLAAIFVLAAATSSAEESATPLSPRAALVELMRHGHVLDGGDRAWLEDHFHLAGRVAARVPFFRLVYPRETARLPAVRALILAHAAGAPRGAAPDPAVALAASTL
jgi:hypothetical protein